jgi:hypothetical protein
MLKQTLHFISTSLFISFKKKQYMRMLGLFVCFQIFTVFSSNLYAQTSTPDVTVVKDWTGLLEAGIECEVYYSLVKCGDEKKVLLKFYNEVPLNQTIKVKVTVKYLGYIVTEEKTVSVAPNQTKMGDCNVADTNLFIKLLPPMWDLEKTVIEAQSIEEKK